MKYFPPLLVLFCCMGCGHLHAQDKEALTTGKYNLVIGWHSGWHITSGSGNVIVGDYLGNDITTQSCQIRIGRLSRKHLKELGSGFRMEGLVCTIEGIQKTCGYKGDEIAEAIKKLQVHP